MSSNIARRDFQDIVDALRSAKGRDGQCTLFIGAGCSKSAGIPLSGEIIADISKKFPGAYQRAKQKYPSPGYNECMHELNPGERRDLLKGYIQSSGMNWAHVGLAQLLAHDYVDRVLTTNFDTLITRACALANRFPAVYDMATSAFLRISDIRDQAIFHLHGQRNGFSLLNGTEELADHAKQLTLLLDHARQNRPWIIVGYSGVADPLFELITAAERYEYGLYWVDVSPEPVPAIADLFQDCRHAYHVHYPEGADKFFMSLAHELDAWPPLFFGNPFEHLRRQLEEIREETAPKTEQGIDWLKGAKEKIAKAANYVTEQSEGAPDKLLAAQSAYLSGNTEQATKDEELDPDARSWMLITIGNALDDEAMAIATTDPATARQLWSQADLKYQQALTIKPNMQEAAQNWGSSLINEANAITKSNPSERSELLDKANAILLTAESIKPGSGSYNLACVEALRGNTEASLHWLRHSQQHNTLPDIDHIRKDTDFASIRHSQEFGAWWRETVGPDEPLE